MPGAPSLVDEGLGDGCAVALFRDHEPGAQVKQDVNPSEQCELQYGKPISAFQLIQAKLSWMAADLYRSQLLALHLGRLKEAGSLSPVQVSIAKMTNVRSAINIARQARTVLGASGVTLEYPLIRHANNLEAVLTYEGTEEIHTLATARRSPASPRTASLKQAIGPGSRYASSLRSRLIRRGGALAQWQSSGLLTHWFRVRPPGAPLTD